jgi:hypothetical protein
VAPEVRATRAGMEPLMRAPRFRDARPRAVLRSPLDADPTSRR